MSLPLTARHATLADCAAIYTSRVLAKNTVSRTMLGELGFREVGLHEKHAPLDGVWHDVVVVERLLPTNLG